MRPKTVFHFFTALFFSATAFSQSNVDSLLKKISDNSEAYQTFSARAKMSWDDGSKQQNFQATIRVQKDSLIWASLGAAGIEGARALITPDSFFLINKLADEYNQNDFVFLQRLLLFPVNFKMLQQLIAGGKISIGEKIFVASDEDSVPVIFLESEKLLEKIWVDTAHYTPEKILLKDKFLRQDMTITFDDYNYSEQKPFSYKREIVINRDTATLNLSMEFTKINFDTELSFPFEVNKKYKREE